MGISLVMLLPNGISLHTLHRAERERESYKVIYNEAAIDILPLLSYLLFSSLSLSLKKNMKI